MCGSRNVGNGSSNVGPYTRSLKLCGTNLNLYDNVQRAVALPLLHVHVDQSVGQAQAGVPIHRVLQARHRGLTGQVTVALGDARGQRRADAHRPLGFRKPGQPPIGGQTPAVKGGFQGQGGGGGERIGCCGRLRRQGGLLRSIGLSDTSTIAQSASVPQPHE